MVIRNASARVGTAVTLASGIVELLGVRGSLEVPMGDYRSNPRPSLQVPVQVDKGRRAYGQIRVRVRPVGGSGSAWVNADRVRLELQPGATADGRPI